MPTMESLDPLMTRRVARRQELDTLRGFAVLGIFWVNIVYFGWPYDARLYPVLFGGRDAWNAWGWTG